MKSHTFPWLATCCAISGILWLAILEFWGTAALLGVALFGVWAILVAAEGLHGYPRDDRDPPGGAA